MWNYYSEVDVLGCEVHPEKLRVGLQWELRTRFVTIPSLLRRRRRRPLVPSSRVWNISSLPVGTCPENSSDGCPPAQKPVTETQWNWIAASTLRCSRIRVEELKFRRSSSRRMKMFERSINWRMWSALLAWPGNQWSLLFVYGSLSARRSRCEGLRNWNLEQIIR